jgi:replication factor A1
MVFWDDRAEKAFNFSRGDELLIQGANIKLDREGVPEIQTSRSTYVTKVGHTALPPLEEKFQEIGERESSVLKDINEISSKDEYVSIQVSKGPQNEVREFTRKDGSIGNVLRTILFDKTGIIIVVFWNETIKDFEGVTGKSLKIENLRVNLSKYQTIELHSNNNIIITDLGDSQVIEVPPIQEIESLDIEKGIACIEGILQDKTDIREFNRSDGTAGRVASLTIEDKTGITRVVGWNDNVDKFESLDLETTKSVQILYGGIRKNQDDLLEIHLNNQSKVIHSEEIPPNLVNIQKREPVSSSYTEIDYIRTNLAELPSDADGDTIEIVGKIIRLFQQTPYYWACPECNKRVNQSEDDEEIWLCQEHDKIKPILRFRLSGLLDDSTSTIKVTFFGLSGEILTGFKKGDVIRMIEEGKSDDEIFEELQVNTEGKTVRILGRVQMRTQEIDEETIQSQELFANRVQLPSPKGLSENLLGEMEG